MANDELAIYLHEEHIGDLWPTRKGARFRFLDEVVATRIGSPLLSTALLVQAEPFDTSQTRNWFTGLLPEDDRLSELCSFYRISQNDYLAVLEAIGWECAGAVSVMLEKAVHTNSLSAASFLTLSEQELAARLQALPAHPYDDARSLRISLGGFQEKMCVIAPDPLSISPGYAHFTAVGIPLDGTISTHILKPQPGRFPGMVEAEAWAMAVASQVTPTANTALLQIEGAPLTLVVERFDRVGQGEKLSRLHQEDCAQAMGLSPQQKYAASGSPRKNDPSFFQIASLLTSYSDEPERQLRQLLQQMVVNVALGNTDAHAKNYAFLHPDDFTIALTPLYDVVPAREITPDVVEMGMRINNRIRIDRIGQAQIINEASSWGLSASRSEAIVNETLESIREGLDYANNLYPQAGSRHAQAALERLKSLSD